MSEEDKKTYRVVYNDNYGGFCLYDEMKQWLVDHGIREKYPNIDPEGWTGWDDIPRHEPLLVQCVESAMQPDSDIYIGILKIEEIDTPSYYITDYDGWETVITSKDFVTIEEEV